MTNFVAVKCCDIFQKLTINPFTFFFFLGGGKGLGAVTP